ncbi:MAG: rod shape-determining protein MreD [Deltaproteobacteria bacterium]|nr:rod shape-determining protein MreD [Deltaproteobacteria bacterium]
MRGLAILLLTFVLLALESPLLHAADIQPYAPDLTLIICIYLGLTTPFERGVGLSLVLGLLHDGFATGGTIGMHMEIAVLAFLVSFRLSRRLVLRGPLGSMVVALVFSLGASLVELVLSLVFVRTFTEGTGGPGLILSAMIPQALVTAPFGAFLFWLLDRLDGLVTRKSESVFM